MKFVITTDVSEPRWGAFYALKTDVIYATGIMGTLCNGLKYSFAGILRIKRKTWIFCIMLESNT